MKKSESKIPSSLDSTTNKKKKLSSSSFHSNSISLKKPSISAFRFEKPDLENIQLKNISNLNQNISQSIEKPLIINIQKHDSMDAVTLNKIPGTPSPRNTEFSNNITSLARIDFEINKRFSTSAKKGVNNSIIKIQKRGTKDLTEKSNTNFEDSLEKQRTNSLKKNKYNKVGFSANKNKNYSSPSKKEIIIEEFKEKEKITKTFNNNLESFSKKKIL